MSNRTPILSKIILIADQAEMDADERNVWFCLGALWEQHGVDFNPSLDWLAHLLGRSKAFVKNAIKKLRTHLLVAKKRGQYVAGPELFNSQEALGKKYGIEIESYILAQRKGQILAPGGPDIGLQVKNGQILAPERPDTGHGPGGAKPSHYKKNNTPPIVPPTASNIIEVEKLEKVCVGEDLPDGFKHLGHGAVINCESIKHSDFTISIKALEMVLALQYPTEDGKKRAREIGSFFGLCWAAEIEAGGDPQKVLPSSIPAWIRSSAIREYQKSQTHKAEMSRKKKSFYREDGKFRG